MPSPSHDAAHRGPLPLPDRERGFEPRTYPSPIWGEGGARLPQAGGRVRVCQSPSNSGVRFSANASKARRKSFVAMQIAWA